MPSPDVPIACTLAAGDRQTRRALIAELNAAALRTARRDDLTVELTYAPEARDRVLEWVRLERDCCAFLDFAVREEPGGLAVTISAPEAARQAAVAIFEAFGA